MEVGKNNITNAVIVCIARNEQQYINEWINYHIMLGFDKIIIYEHLFKHTYTTPFIKNIEIRQAVDSPTVQLTTYNKFIDNNYDKFKYAFFIDIDEFLYLPGKMLLPQLLQKYEDKNELSFLYRIFGDSNLSGKQIKDYSVINRFLWCSKYNKTSNRYTNIKTMINLLLSKNTRHIIGHTTDHTPFIVNNNIAEIYHYQVKTLQEYLDRKLQDHCFYRKHGYFDIESVTKIFNHYNYNQIYNDNMVKKLNFLQDLYLNKNG